MRATVLIDARNVLRSRWPNIAEPELIDSCTAWAAEQGVRAVLVFDGDAPARVVASPAAVVATGPETADDWIAREAARLAEHGERYWLVTSDRRLRERAGAHAERVIGGGTLARAVG